MSFGDEPNAASGRLAGKLGVVSGASRGIGYAIAAAFVREGAHVIRLDIAHPAEPIEGSDVRRMDATSEEAWRDLAAELQDTPPDILVNNAGGLLDASPLHNHATESWRATLDLNLTSVFFGMRAFIPQMVARGSGSIVNIGSISGLRAQPDAPAYQAAKAGVAILTRNAALTYARFGVRVNTLTPSLVATEALAQEPSERTRSFLARVPLGRAADPPEIAAIAVFLASDESSFVTGADIAVDGGYLA